MQAALTPPRDTARPFANCRYRHKPAMVLKILKVIDMRIFTLTITVLLFFAPVATAQNRPDDASLIQLNTRIFDLRADVRNLRRDDDFIPLTEIEWLRMLTDEDEYLEPTVVHIKAARAPVLKRWKTLEPDRDFPITENIPSMFLLDGYQTRSGHPSNRRLLLVPIDDSTDFTVHCNGGNIEKHRFCTVSATYPPDPNIWLLARVYHPEPPFHFREIAHRIREIAYCLDVTEAVNSGAYKAGPYVDPDKDLPELRNCYDPIS